MLRDSDGDIGGGKFIRSGSYALSFCKPTSVSFDLLRSEPPFLLFDRSERLTLGKFAEKGSASRNLQAPGRGDSVRISPSQWSLFFPTLRSGLPMGG